MIASASLGSCVALHLYPIARKRLTVYAESAPMLKTVQVMFDRLLRFDHFA